MGYNLYIGEFEVDSTPEDRYCLASVRAEPPREDAPLNSSELRTNFCWPSYTAWWNFVSKVGLTDLFYDERGQGQDLLESHPGCAELTESHLVEFSAARERYLSQGGYVDIAWEDYGRDYDLARLDWLCYWTK